MSSNRVYGSYGSGGNSNNGGQATQKPKVVHKSDKTYDTAAGKQDDPRYWKGSDYYGKGTGKSNDPRYYGTSGRH